MAVVCSHATSATSWREDSGRADGRLLVWAHGRERTCPEGRAGLPLGWRSPQRRDSAGVGHRVQISPDLRRNIPADPAEALVWGVGLPTQHGNSVQRSPCVRAGPCACIRACWVGHLWGDGAPALQLPFPLLVCTLGAASSHVFVLSSCSSEGVWAEERGCLPRPGQARSWASLKPMEPSRPSHLCRACFIARKCPEEVQVTMSTYCVGFFWGREGNSCLFAEPFCPGLQHGNTCHGNTWPAEAHMRGLCPLNLPCGRKWPHMCPHLVTVLFCVCAPGTATSCLIDGE